MKVLILGIDGYIGWPLALHLERAGHEVAGIDDFSRRALGESLTPIEPKERCARFTFYEHDISEYPPRSLLCDWQPDAIVHLAEMPSAPWSMRGVEQAVHTHRNNVEGTLRLLWAMREFPHAHLVKLGTMGEYGTPHCRIPEGAIPESCLDPAIEETLVELDVQNACPMNGLPFPRSPGSFYHLTKVHDTHNIIFACKTWGLRATDIMQGVVYGITDHTPKLVTRFDYDQYFGTAINRFMAQALAGLPITPYGKGLQRRGFLPLGDSLRCLQLAIENPPQPGEYRTFNQFADVYTINELAEIVACVALEEFGCPVAIEHIPNPRKEAEEHYYNPDCRKLKALGYSPSLNIHDVIARTMSVLSHYSYLIDPEAITPTTFWCNREAPDGT